MEPNERLILFGNVVYSTKPKYWKDQFMGGDPLHERMFAQKTDEKLFEMIDAKKTHLGRYGVPGELFLFDEVLTRQRCNIREMQSTSRYDEYDFSCMRKIIVDDRYPIYVDYVRKFKRLTGSRRTAIALGNYSITFGRVCLLEAIRYAKYGPALPELREIILHDYSNKMAENAIHALQDMKTKESMLCINELLNDKTLSQYRKFELIDAAEHQGNDIVLPGLKRCFEEYYHWIPEDYDDRYGYPTLQQYILEACATIPTLEALFFLEQGIGHPYNHVERAAYNSIKSWIRMMLHRIQEGYTDNLELHIADAIKRYDMNVFSTSYNALRKRSAYYQKFKTLTIQE
jgi:hypothetical protein